MTVVVVVLLPALLMLATVVLLAVVVLRVCENNTSRRVFTIRIQSGTHDHIKCKLYYSALEEMFQYHCCMSTYTQP